MVWVNVIRGERIEAAPWHVRPPVIHIPLWASLLWSLAKGAAVLVAVTVRFWYLTAPAVLLGWLFGRFGWPGPVLTSATVAVGLLAWWRAHPASFRRWVWLPILGRWRRWRYRRIWLPAMSTAGLVVVFDRHTVVPILRRVTTSGVADVLTVRMVTGQIPDDYAAVAERLAHTFAAQAARIRPGARPDLVAITLRRRDCLAAVVGPLPIPATPDFTGLPVGLTEDGDLFRLRLFGTQVLVVGATGAGKGSVIWSVVAALAAGIRCGLVKVWGVDPKGGMELAPGAALFDRFACHDFEAMADLFDQAVSVMRERTARLRGHTRQHTPTVDDPLYLIIVDELAALTAYLTDRKLKDRIRATLGLILTQGRAVGVHILACLQDPRKEILPFRDLFPTRIGLRMSEPAHVDLTLGDGIRDRGARCDRIPVGVHAAGIGYVVLDGDPTPVRVRFSFLTDADIADLARQFQPGNVIDGELAQPTPPTTSAEPTMSTVDSRSAGRIPGPRATPSAPVLVRLSDLGRKESRR